MNFSGEVKQDTRVTPPGIQMPRSTALQFGTRSYGGVSARKIAIFVYEHCSFIDVGLIVETFHLANARAREGLSGRPRYSISLLSNTGGLVQCSSSISVATMGVDPSMGGFDTLFIAGGNGAAEAARDTHTAEWLVSVFPTIRVVQASGNGALLLRAADLPHARGVNIPMQSPRLRHGPPSSNGLLDANADSPVVTALSIVKTDFDYETAEIIAEQLIPNSGAWMSRLLGETPSSDVSARIRESTRWMEKHYDRSTRVEDAAQIASMGERTFLRCFKREVGVTPSEYLLRLRLNMACKLLVTTTLPIDSIARKCGMRSGAQIARIFRKYLGMSATDFRDNTSFDLTGDESPCTGP